MATMSEEFFCKRCQKNVPHVHFCTPTEEAKTYKCEFCNKEGVNHRHMCKGKLKHIAFYCRNCGVVAVSEDHVCNPAPISEVDADIKAEWEKVKAETKSLTLESCKTCGQPVKAPGHYCDRKVPFQCPYCGAKVENNYHVCKNMMGKFKYICKTCGRLGIEKTDICIPQKL
jgi:hypothetical protein